MNRQNQINKDLKDILDSYAEDTMNLEEAIDLIVLAFQPLKLLEKKEKKP